jgi:membrane-associated phospholipid phosphatase
MLAGSAQAEPWYRGEHGHNRVVHVSITFAGAALYASSESFLKPYLAPATCRWCAVDSLDASVRNAVVWSDPHRAVVLSNIDGYVVAPIFAVGLTMLGSLTSDDPSRARVIDDGVPVLETVALSEIVDQTFKFVVARQRPYAHFRPPATAGLDDNVSFFSGHSVLVFGVATSAGVIAHKRHSWTEPYIWIGGGALAVSTAYLRMAADEHYLTDVLTGAAVGVGSGLLVPKLMDRSIEVVPTGRGVAVAGTF